MSDPQITPLSPTVQDDSTPISSSPPTHPSAGTEPTKSPKPFGSKFSIWPPTQRTRDAVISRLIETLSTPSILSKRYGTLPPEDAASVARVIEEEAYATAGGSPSTEDDGIEVLQVYSKEISKRMLEAVKGRATPVENGERQGVKSPVAPPNVESPTLETES